MAMLEGKPPPSPRTKARRKIRSNAVSAVTAESPVTKPDDQETSNLIPPSTYFLLKTISNRWVVWCMCVCVCVCVYMCIRLSYTDSP
jgi:hypothetical protein